MEKYLQLQVYLHTNRLDGDFKVEGSNMTTKHSKYPNREFWTVNLAKTKPEDHAEGQGTGLACNIN